MAAVRLDRLWSLVEDHPDLLATRAEWKESLRGEYNAASPYLVATREISTAWLCGRPGTPGCFRHVVEHARDHLVAVCPEQRCDRIKLRRADVVLHRLNLHLLAQALSRALELPAEGVEPLGDGHPDSAASFRLGQALLDGRSVAFYFTRRASTDQLLPVIEHIRQRDPATRVGLLLPQDGMLAPNVRTTAYQADVSFVPLLRAAKEVRGDIVVAVDEFLASARAERPSAPAADEPTRRPVFRRSSSTVWEVGFGATDSFHLGNLLGAPCVHFLLSNPGRDVHCLRLKEVSAGGPPPEAKRGTPPATGDESGERASYRGESIHVDAITDPDALRAYHERLKALGGELEKATADNDHGRIDRIRREQAALRAEVGRATDKRGQARIADAAEKARKSVSANIHRVFKAIEDENEEMAAHLRAFMRPESMMWSYRPDTNVEWVL